MNIHIEDARQVRDMVASLVTILEALDAAGVREPDDVDIMGYGDDAAYIVWHCGQDSVELLFEASSERVYWVPLALGNECDGLSFHRTDIPGIVAWVKENVR